MRRNKEESVDWDAAIHKFENMGREKQWENYTFEHSAKPFGRTISPIEAYSWFRDVGFDPDGDVITISIPTLERMGNLKERYFEQLGKFYAGKTIKWKTTKALNRSKCDKNNREIAVNHGMIEYPEGYTYQQGMANCDCVACKLQTGRDPWDDI